MCQLRRGKLRLHPSLLRTTLKYVFIQMNAMVFCNTCDQALCNECRRLIHSAKMFAKHDVVPVEKRTQKQKKTCGNLIILS